MKQDQQRQVASALADADSALRRAREILENADVCMDSPLYRNTLNGLRAVERAVLDAADEA